MVTITRPKIFPIAMPSHDEMVELLAISRALLFPRAPPLSTYDGQIFFQQFITSFQYISTLRRSAELKDRADLWIDRCQNWVQERNGEFTSIGLSAFLCGIGAAGDITFRYDASTWPFGVHVGLSWNEGPAATPTRWTGVLQTKEIRASVPLAMSPRATPVPTIRQLAIGGDPLQDDYLRGDQSRPFQ